MSAALLAGAGIRPYFNVWARLGIVRVRSSRRRNEQGVCSFRLPYAPSRTHPNASMDLGRTTPTVCPLRFPGLRSARHGPCSPCTRAQPQRHLGRYPPQRFRRLHRYFRILANPCSLSGTLYAEAQRRYLESVSPFARHLFISSWCPKSAPSTTGAPRHCTSTAARLPTTHSSVGSVTTLSNLLRMLYSRAGDYPPKAPILHAENFSPKRPEGACPECHGRGRILPSANGPWCAIPR